MMKKLLSILLATATVFSTTAFASPAAESIETADEISLNVGGGVYFSSVSDVSLSAETTDYYDATLGVALINEDFENGIGKWVAQGGWPVSTTAEIVEDEENRKSVKITVPKNVNYAGIHLSDSALNVPGEFAVSTQYKVIDGTFSLQNGLSVKKSCGAAQWGYYYFGFSEKFSDDKKREWQTVFGKTNPITQANLTENEGIQAFYIMFNSTADTDREILIDNIKLYYKPIEKIDYTVVSAVYPTVTVSAPEGIDDNAVIALTAEPQKYFGDIVKSCAIDSNTNTITLTVNGEGEVSLPSVVNADQKKTYNSMQVTVEKIDELAPTLGVALIDEDFENGIGGWKTHGGWPVSTTEEIVEDEENGQSAKITILKNVGDAGINLFDSALSVPGEFTFSAQYKSKTNFAANHGLNVKTNTGWQEPNKDPYAPYGYYYLTKFEYSADSLDTWQTFVSQKRTVTQEMLDHNEAIRAFYIIFDKVTDTDREIFVDNIKLYYKPIDKDEYGAITKEPLTITVNAANGFEERAAKAIKANPQKYLSDAVEKVEFNDTAMIITLNRADYGSITIPALVNKDKTATYPETKIEAQKDIAPVTLNEKELRLTSTNSGIRFKAYVLHENLENLDEYGYIVALENTLKASGKTFTDLTFELDKNTVKYVSEAAYVKGRETNYIFSNNYDVNGSTANLFTGVLTGIPKGKYHLNLVARPYAKSSDGKYYYGEPISGNVNELAIEIKNNTELYNSLKPEQKAIIDEFAANAA